MWYTFLIFKFYQIAQFTAESRFERIRNLFDSFLFFHFFYICSFIAIIFGSQVITITPFKGRVNLKWLRLLSLFFTKHFNIRFLLVKVLIISHLNILWIQIGVLRWLLILGQEGIPDSLE